MSLAVSGRDGEMIANDQNVKGDYGTADGLTIAAIPFLPFPGIDLIAIPFLIAGANAASSASVIQKNFVDNEWHNQTLSPGAAGAGVHLFQP
jgi:hypothetical protein